MLFEQGVLVVQLPLVVEQRFTPLSASVCQVISSNPDTSGSFLLQWGLQCWPEDGKYKCLEPLPTTESNKLDVFLGQLGSNGSELKLK